MHINNVLVFAAAAPSILVSAAPDDTTNTASLRGLKHQNTNRISTNSNNKIVSFPVIPHHEIQNRRRRELNIDESWVSEDEGVRRNLSDEPRHQQLGALYQGYGTHYVDVWVGKPEPQRQTVIVDTGSSVTAFPCSGCTDCGESYHTDGYFLTESSDTYVEKNCESQSHCLLGSCRTLPQYDNKVCSIRMSYAEGSSWSAVEATDTVYAGGLHDGALVHGDDKPDAVANAEEHIGDNPQDAYVFEFDLTFGCEYGLTGLFKTQLATGIMGMEQSERSFWKQMHSANAIDDKVFSLCYSRQPTASREGTEAGAMTLGGTDTRLHKTPMVYADIKSSSGHFPVTLKAIYIRSNGGESALPDSDDQVAVNIGANTSSMRVIVDSGTTDTYLPRSIHDTFAKHWKKAAGVPFSNKPVDLTHDELLALPTILFQLEAHANSVDVEADPKTTVGLAGLVDENNPNDIIIAMPASHYMEYSSEKKKYVSRVYLSEGSGGVLGANLMMGHDIVFDMDQGRIGFAESECDYMSIIEGAEAPTRK